MSENLIGATTAVFPIRLSVAVASPVDVEWATRDGSAVAGSDYKATAGTVTFLPGETEKQIEVQVYGQAITPSDDKVFFIRLNPPSNAVLVDAILTCTINIIDDQGIPSVAVIVAEGRRGPKGNPGLSAYEQAVLMGYTGTVEQWMDEIGDASQAAEKAESFASQAAESAVVAGQKADEAAESAVVAGQKADEAVDAVGSTKQYVDSALASQSAYLDSELANQTQTVNSALSDLSTAANKFYSTLAAANADIANIAVDQPVTIGESTNGGLWYKATAGATSLTKSPYDPLTQAKDFTSEKVVLDDLNTTDVARLVDVYGRPVFIIKKDGKVFLVGLNNDLLSVVNAIDVTDLISESLSTDILELKDANGVVALKLTADGDLFIPKIGNLTEEIIRSKSLIQDGILQDEHLAANINAIDVTDLISESSSANVLELKDANGVVALKLTADGDLFIPKIGNLTDEIIRSKSSSQSGSLQAEHLAAKYADYALSQTQEYFETDQTLLTKADVAPYFSHSIYQVRIPAITRIAENKYLICFEARESGDDFGLISLGSAILTVDLATKVVSTSNIQVLHEAFIDEQSKLRTFMNACTVKLPTGKIICLYARRYGAAEHELYMRTSLDDGATWSNYTDISAVKNTADLNLLCPCSQGLVKRYGKNKDRIVFPAWTTGAAYNVADFRSGYIYSDDDGATWNIGGFISVPSSNEVQCAEDLNGDLLFACRIELSVPYKIVVRLKDADDVWEYITPNINFNDGPVMSGLIQGDNIYDDSANKFMMSTCKNEDRTGLLVHTSYDGGYTWRSYLLPSTIGQFVAYTCIENITPEFKLLIRENITGGINASVINLKNLIA